MGDAVTVVNRRRRATAASTGRIAGQMLFDDMVTEDWPAPTPLAIGVGGRL